MLSPFMVSSATPMTAEIVCAPASNPAVSPALYPIKVANNQVITKQPTHMSTANPTWGKPSFFSPRKNCGPTLYPMAKRNKRKNTDFTGSSIVMLSCPTNTPTSNTLVTIPKLNCFIFIFPIQKPTAIVRKIASSECCLKRCITHSIFLSYYNCCLKQSGGKEVELKSSKLYLVLIFFILFA